VLLLLRAPGLAHVARLAADLRELGGGRGVLVPHLYDLWAVLQATVGRRGRSRGLAGPGPSRHVLPGAVDRGPGGGCCPGAADQGRVQLPHHRPAGGPAGEARGVALARRNAVECKAAAGPWLGRRLAFRLGAKQRRPPEAAFFGWGARIRTWTDCYKGSSAAVTPRPNRH